MSKLKPCPFCGDSNVLIEREGTNRVSCIISCADCGGRLESNEVGFGLRWNTRVESAEITNLRAINAKLVEALEGLCSWESPLTQDKWDIAREAIAESKAVQG